MRAEKAFISQEYVSRLNQSPFFIVVDYRAMKVTHFTELRKRLRANGNELHVVKNSIFRVAVKEVGTTELTGVLAGQLAVVTGSKDVTAAAKVVKTFQSEFDKPKLLFGYLGNNRLEASDLKVLADLPSIEVLRSKLLGTLLAPASTLVRLLNTPGSQLARVLQARVDKEAEPAAVETPAA